MKTNIQQLHPGNYYHIYNRGINGCNIFYLSKNYNYFIKKYFSYINPIAKTYAYCLLDNHFHFLVKIRTEKVISILNKNRNVEMFISQRFSNFFNCYAQAINNSISRTGGLFERPFRRILVDDDIYLTNLIFYIHLNPEKHGYVNDFKKYPYSSYQTLINNKNTFLERKEVINWFGSSEAFIKDHQEMYKEFKANKDIGFMQYLIDY